MATRKRVVKSADERSSELLAAARDVFTRKGAARATVDEITATAGVAKGTFYRYFASKEELVVALREEVGQRLLADFTSRVGTDWQTPEQWWQAVDVVLEIFLDYLVDEFTEHRALFHDPGLAVGQPIGGAFDAFPELLRAGVEQGVFRDNDHELMWVMLFNAVHGLGDHALAAGPIDRDRLVAAARQLVRAALHP